MDDNSKISGGGTYVLDEDELDQLDDLSLTSVMEEATDLFAQPDQEPGEDSPEFEKTDDPQDDSVGQSETVNSPDDLIAPELLFPELSNDDSDDG